MSQNFKWVRQGVPVQNWTKSNQIEPQAIHSLNMQLRAEHSSNCLHAKIWIHTYAHALTWCINWPLASSNTNNVMQNLVCNGYFVRVAIQIFFTISKIFFLLFFGENLNGFHIYVFNISNTVNYGVFFLLLSCDSKKISKFKNMSVCVFFPPFSN